MDDATLVVETEVCASCMAACPVNTDTRGYAEAIAQGDYERALDLLLEANPFPSVCGRICHHPCEEACRRAKVDSPVGLRALKRFVVEQTGDYRKTRSRAVKPPRGKKVAVVGSGPAGLTAAHDLALEGFAVEVFERAATPGGMLGQTIPRYRLPYSVLEEDINDILRLGVKLHTGVEIGRDTGLEDLRGQGFEAVLLATGLSESSSLAVPGIEAEGVYLAMPFLRAAAAGCGPELGERVIVIGGGNVAFDVARTARRLGAKEVTLACLESREEMPAWEWEIQEGLDEGLNVMPSWGPKAVVEEEGKLLGIELKRCTRVFDEAHRFSPQFDEGDVATRLADSIILSIGQRADLTCLEGSPVERDPRGRLRYTPTTMATSEKGVFAAGEVATGPGAAVEAVREGHRVAKAIMHYLETGEVLEQPAPELKSAAELSAEVAEKVRRRERHDPSVLPAEQRVGGFVEIERGLSEEEALDEARRCLACLKGAVVEETLCAGCLTCVRICPYGIPTVDKTASVPAEMCQACGLCAAECPAAGIALTRFSTEKMREQVTDLLKNRAAGEVNRPLLVAYCCLFETTSREFLRPTLEEAAGTGILRVMVPCVARLSVPEIMQPLELGADGVAVLSCAGGECVVPTAEVKLAAHVRRARALIEGAGVEPDRIQHFQTEESAERSWTGFLEQARGRLLELENAAATEVTP